MEPSEPRDGQRDLRALPKAHLHLHFTGSMRPGTVLELAEQHRIRLNTTLSQGLEHQLHLHLSPDVRGWFRFQRLYDAARAVVRGEEDLRRVVREAAQDDAAEGSRWLELQIDPTSYARFVGGITPVVRIVLDEARAASLATGTGVGIVIAASRTRHPLDARALARLAAKHAGDEAGAVVGFGLSNDERSGWTADFAPAFGIARRAGLASVPHGGELLGPSHVAAALEHLAPARLGHGVRAVEDPATLARLVDAGVALEVCPASNVALGVYAQLGDVPLRQLLEAGAQVALGADDPLLFGSRLLDQYRSARTDHGFSDVDLARLAAASVHASRAPAAQKARMLADIDQWLSDDQRPSDETISQHRSAPSIRLPSPSAAHQHRLVVQGDPEPLRYPGTHRAG